MFVTCPTQCQHVQVQLTSVHYLVEMSYLMNYMLQEIERAKGSYSGVVN